MEGRTTLKKPRQTARMRSAKLAAAAQSLNQASGIDSAAFCLAFLTDRTRAPEPEIIIAALPPGAAVILRDYETPDRSALAQKLNALCHARSVLFLVGANLTLAHDIGADGVHFPSWANTRPTPGMIATAACHSARELEKAAAAGAQLALLSPVFATQSHPESEPLGAAQFKSIARTSPLPVLALGGVDETNAAGLAGRNVTGFAAISGFLPD
jgi:thiamine-phosphate pyrophosphorylase